MLTIDKTENLISDEKEIKEALSMIIRDGLDFVAVGVVEKTVGARFLLCEKGFKNPLLKTPGGRPEIYDGIKENPLDTIAREIKEEMGVITHQPQIKDIFLIKREKNREGKYYYVIAFDLKYFSGEIKKGSEISTLEEFSRNAIREIIISKKMVPLHIPIWEHYLKNFWK